MSAGDEEFQAQYRSVVMEEAYARMEQAKSDRSYSETWQKSRLKTQAFQQESAAADAGIIRVYIELRCATERARERAANAEADYWIARAAREAQQK